MQLDQLLGEDRARAFRGIATRALVDAYTENCNRFSEDLGDNSFTYAVLVTQNLRHLLAEALGDDAGIQITRPRGSFQVEIDGRVAVHFYKVRPTAGATGELRISGSRTKADIVRENTQLRLDFADEPPIEVMAGARQLVVMHGGTPTDGLQGVWVGAPFLSPLQGLSWLWLESFEGRETVVAGDAGRVANWIDDSELPELEVRLKAVPPHLKADASQSA